MKSNRYISSISGACTPRPKFLGALKKRKLETREEQLKDYFVGNPLKVLSVLVLLIGGFQFLIYFWSIKYFPSGFNLESASGLLVAISITGLGFAVLLAFYLMLPGLLWREVICEEKMLQSLLLDEKGNPQKVGRFFTVPMVLAATTLLVLAFFDWPFSWGLVALPLSVGLLAYDEKRSLKNAGEADGKCCTWCNVKVVSKHVNLICLIIVNAFFSTLLIVFAFYFSRNNQEDFWIIFLSIIFLLIICNHFVASLGRNRIWWLSPVFAVSVLVFVLLLTDNISVVPKATMRLLKLGDIENSTLVLDQQGCQIAQQFVAVSTVSPDFQKATDKSALKETTSAQLCSIASITILSRIGDEYYLATPNKSGRFVIPSTHVLSWLVPEGQ